MPLDDLAHVRIEALAGGADGGLVDWLGAGFVHISGDRIKKGWKAPSCAPVLPGERAEERRPLVRAAVGRQVLDWSGQAPRPVQVADDRGHVDAIPPAEDVLDRAG